MTARRRQEWILSHPVLDQPLALAAGLLVGLLRWRAGIGDGSLTTVVIGVTTIAALAMTAATFICAMTYQSANILMARVRDRYAADLKRNWGSIIGGSFVGAALPVIALAATDSRPWVLGVSCYSLALVVLRFARAAFWLKYTLFMQEASEVITRVPLSDLVKH